MTSTNFTFMFPKDCAAALFFDIFFLTFFVVSFCCCCWQVSVDSFPSVDRDKWSDKNLLKQQSNGRSDRLHWRPSLTVGWLALAPFWAPMRDAGRYGRRPRCWSSQCWTGHGHSSSSSSSSSLKRRRGGGRWWEEKKKKRKEKKRTGDDDDATARVE